LNIGFVEIEIVGSFIRADVSRVLLVTSFFLTGLELRAYTLSHSTNPFL
jgi:hypothetical protein